MQYLQVILGLIAIIVMALVVSSDKKIIKIRYIAQMLILEVGIAYFLLNTSIGTSFVSVLAGGFNGLLGYAFKGTQFVFGGLINAGQFSFFLNVLMSIVLISALIGILQFTKIMPIFINAVGFVLSKINGMGKLESFNAVSALMVGQSENFITYKDILGKMSERRMYTLAATGMSTVSMSIVGSYMQILEPKFVVTALFLNMFSAFIVLSIINPYDHAEELSIDEMKSSADVDQLSFFEMLGEYIITGFKIAVLVGAMLVGFIALIEMVNGIFISLTGHSFQEMLGYVFYPIAWLMGVPSNEALKAGSIMATKIVSNEFVAMMSLKDIAETLSPKTVGIVSTFLVSFANLSSIGIISGAVRGIDAKMGDVVARFGLKLLYGATLVSILSATIVGIML